jgi:Ca-activated chloride channel family protein
MNHGHQPASAAEENLFPLFFGVTRRVRAKQHRFSLLLFLGLAPSCTQAQQPTPPIRVTVNRVNVGVTVTDSAGHFVERLRREDFQVFDNEVEQPIADFLPIEEPAQLLLLIESGPAVLFLSKNHLLAADTLLATIAPADSVAIASYSRDPQLLLNFTTNKAQARAALYDINFANGFADLNLSSSLASAIDWLAPRPGKKTIVLLSTGFDSSPPENPQTIQRKLLTSDVRFIEADKSLRKLSALTGGRVFFPTNADEFSHAYAEIAQLVRHEYSIAFAPPTADGQLHSLKIETKHHSYQVNHRQAYIAPQE